MLNTLWLLFFVLAAGSSLYQWLVVGNAQIFAEMVQALFEMADLSVHIMIVLFGTLSLWLGFLQIAEKAGLIEKLAKWLSPVFSRLMPEVPAGHPALGLITLNFAANGLGLDNAATPIGLRAMRALQELNPNPKTATNAQILFLVLNTSALSLLPISIFMYRLQQGAPDPTMVFLPILLATTASSVAGLLAVAIVQRIRLWDPILLLWFGTAIALLAIFMASLATLTASALNHFSSLLGNLSLLAVIFLFLFVGWRKKIPLYDSFIEGAKGGYAVARDLLPYLLAMLCAIGLLRSSGALEIALSGIRWVVDSAGWDNRFVDALPTALMRPFSGGAARALLIETMQHHGVDSFAALLAATFQGSTETTFYVLAVYFGAVGIQRARHAIGCALIADAAGMAAAIAVSYWFYG